MMRVATASALPSSDDDMDTTPETAASPHGRTRSHLTLVPQASAPPVVQTAHLAKTFVTGFWRTRHEALRDVSLRVEARETFGLLGANGAGKTTLFKLLLGLVRPSAGDGELLGRPLGDPEARAHVGFLPEVPAFPDTLTPAEVLEFGAKLRGYTGAAARRAAADAMERTGLTAHARKNCRALSKGLAQRVGLAHAILHRPKLLVLDEPMSGLDPLGRAEVREVIAQLADDGVSIIFSSHILPDVQSLCARVGLLVGGRLVATGSPEEVLRLDDDAMEIVTTGGGPVPPHVKAVLTNVGATYAVRGDGGMVIHAPRPVLNQVLHVVLGAQRHVLSVLPRGTALTQTIRDASRDPRDGHDRRNGDRRA